MLKRASTTVQVSWKWLCQCLTLFPRNISTFGMGMSSDPSYTYWGWFKNGKFDGLGIQICKTGSLYMGQWKNDEAEGIGIHISLGTKDKYEGYFKNGNFNGSGHYAWTGGEFRGNFKDGAFDGDGVCVYEDGTRYEGQFKEGKRWGKGRMFFQSGDRYEGEFCDGKRHGRGTYFFKNGDVHDGQYANGKRHGKGVYKFSQNGKTTEKFVVEFCDGVPVQGSVRQLLDLPADEAPDIPNNNP